MEGIVIKVKYAGDGGEEQFFLNLDILQEPVFYRDLKLAGPVEGIKIRRYSAVGATPLRGDF
jgi:hypothetical protein